MLKRDAGPLRVGDGAGLPRKLGRVNGLPEHLLVLDAVVAGALQPVDLRTGRQVANLGQRQRHRFLDGVPFDGQAVALGVDLRRLVLAPDEMKLGRA